MIYKVKKKPSRADRCKASKPWEHSTGPKTAKGKAASARNSYKHGGRDATMRNIEYILARQNEFLKKLRQAYDLNDKDHK
jgi:hypothetical protein